MLRDVRIRDLGVIAEALLELGPGLTVLTGETGAGKTLVVGSLALLLGGKADPGAVRAGAPTALVEGRVTLAPGSPAAARAEELGAELEDGELLLARSVSSSRSRAWAGGRSVPASVLGEIGEELVVVHGQSDQQRLLRPGRQRELLDRYAGPPVAALLEEHAAGWARLRELERRTEELRAGRREREQEADLLRYGLERVAQVAPQPGEDAALREEAERLGSADELRRAAEVAHAALLGDPDSAGDGADAVALVGAARRQLESAATADPELAALAARVAESAYLLADLGADLAAYAAGIEADPARLAQVQERRAALAELCRRYGDTVDEVLAWSERSALRLAELDGDDDRTSGLVAEAEALRERLGTVAGRLSAERAAAAVRLGEAVTAELRELAMPRASVEVVVQQRTAGAGEPALDVAGQRLAAGPTGVDEVELLLAANAGAPGRGLARAASGGELSRVMLALEVVLAEVDPVPTFVFDEVDAGVGGRAAVEIGRRLAALAEHAQVLVVTHLPQVAAYADRHLLVAKDSDGTVTTSGVRALDDGERVREISRMLSGLEGSATGLAHAEELLTTARGTR
ncbi:DNA replication and repair protein RecN [Motilibacter rhizosphaerae]|uniref:DNA repair protein RecN n=1 Tax=Motilibacter rhizosphaerae TaxID=598652 RepID=A0A4Q7NBJ5_9ACTN|nr:DNA repair protein RecN [Motilibacter rhizosphaerae]RZS80233.1 DNA replication and repair protein RecN [Motilibacter rhizosphaerae]